jgi:predicted dehydrogenase
LLSFKNGAIALLENAWLAGSAVGSLQAQSYFKVQGTRGLIEVKSDDHSVTIHAGGMMYSPDTVYMPADARGHIVGVYRDQLDHFVHCVREGIPTDVPLVDGKQAVVVAEAICQSARHRREIVLG